MAWNLHITGPAQKEFLKLPPKDQARVKNALLAMQQDPFSATSSA
jgi:mRNA-degrading endonuclease RelE of RelBE toxin-antitoxin system